MLKRIGKDRNWQDIKKKCEEVYSSIAIEVHAVSDLHWKEWPDETARKHTNFTDLTEKAMGVDPANITNWVIILFIKNFYNKDIRWWRAGVKTINTLADTI